MTARGAVGARPGCGIASLFERRRAVRRGRAAGRGHDRIEARSIWLRRAVEAELRADRTAVVGRARANLARMRDAHGPGAAADMDRWADLLDGPLDGFASVLASTARSARDLRQCTPFAGVRSPAERWAAYRAFADARGDGLS